jgi:23S rRNA (cytosine1962-C5)-methyltransferase
VKSTIKSLTLNPKEDRRLLRGHLWAYRNEFHHIPEGMADGEVVDVFSDGRRFVGRGFYQTQGGIAVRVVTRHQEELDAEFFLARFAAARSLRARLFPESCVYRWIYGESDGLPGLVADRYGSVVVVRAASVFYDSCAEAIAEACMADNGATGVVFAWGNTTKTFGTVPELVPLDVDGVRAELNLAEAQKTGLFLDQRRNWQSIRTFAGNARVFDGHCYHGFWSCNAALAGARSVLGVDTSEKAVEQARRNAALNGAADRCEFVKSDVETVLGESTKFFDVVVLDPPALAKNRTLVRKALPRYQAINALALGRIAPEGGFLITSSCSHFVDTPTFLETVKYAASAAGRRVSLLEMRGAAPDHPILLAMPETAYLKCAVLRVE